jgi:hypothetical protein
VNRDAQPLAGNVPQGHLDPTQGAEKVHGPPPPGEIVVHHPAKVLDVPGVTPHEIAGQVLDVPLDGAVAVELGVALAPADDVVVGLDADKEPVLAADHPGAVTAGVDEERLDVADAHGTLLCTG